MLLKMLWSPWAPLLVPGVLTGGEGWHCCPLSRDVEGRRACLRPRNYTLKNWTRCPPDFYNSFIKQISFTFLVSGIDLGLINMEIWDLPADNPNSLCISIKQLCSVSPSVSLGRHQTWCFAVMSKSFDFFNPCFVVGEEERSPLFWVSLQTSHHLRGAALYSISSKPTGASLMAQWVKNLSAMQETQETWVRSLGQEDPLE